MFVVFDLDGTLALIEHRRHLVAQKPKNWPRFFEQCVHDEPILPIIAILHALRAAGHRVEVWSGRSDIVKAQTLEWLTRHGIEFDALRMRPQKDSRADDLLKEEWLLSLATEERPTLIFDDRDRVVALWRRHGIRCCQVAPGDF